MIRGRLTLYTRPGCILCAQVRQQLLASGLTFREIEVKSAGDQSKLLSDAGAVGFPALFVGERYVGGYSHVIYLLTQGRLKDVQSGE